MEIRPILSFGFDINDYESEVIMKGYCNDVLVVLPDFSRFKVCFYDPTRLIQDLKEEGYIAESGLVVIDEVTKSNMEKVVYELWRSGFFDSLKPIDSLSRSS